MQLVVKVGRLEIVANPLEHLGWKYSGLRCNVRRNTLSSGTVTHVCIFQDKVHHSCYAGIFKSAKLWRGLDYPLVKVTILVINVRAKSKIRFPLTVQMTEGSWLDFPASQTQSS